MKAIMIDLVKSVILVAKNVQVSQIKNVKSVQLVFTIVVTPVCLVIQLVQSVQAQILTTVKVVFPQKN